MFINTCLVHITSDLIIPLFIFGHLEAGLHHFFFPLVWDCFSIFQHGISQVCQPILGRRENYWNLWEEDSLYAEMIALQWVKGSLRSLEWISLVANLLTELAVSYYQSHILMFSCYPSCPTKKEKENRVKKLTVIYILLALQVSFLDKEDYKAAILDRQPFRLKRCCDNALSCSFEKW